MLFSIKKYFGYIMESGVKYYMRHFPFYIMIPVQEMPSVTWSKVIIRRLKVCGLEIGS